MGRLSGGVMIMRTERLLISRRSFLHTLGLVASVGLIQACAPSAPAPSAPAASTPAQTTPAAQPTTAAAQPTAVAAQSAAQPTTTPATAAKPAQQAPAATKPGGTLVAGWDSAPGALDSTVDRGAVTRTLRYMFYDLLVEQCVYGKAVFTGFLRGLASSGDVAPVVIVYIFQLPP